MRGSRIRIGEAHIMSPRSYERIIPKVAADIRLYDFPADALARKEVFVLALRAIIAIACGHIVHGDTAGIQINGTESTTTVFAVQAFKKRDTESAKCDGKAPDKSAVQLAAVRQRRCLCLGRIAGGSRRLLSIS